MNVTTVGLDLAKNVFQVHGIDNTGKVIVQRSLRERLSDEDGPNFLADSVRSTPRS